MTRLTVELVPSTCWWSNVRSHVAPAVWERLRRATAAAAGNRCEICGGRGRRHPVECHEVWDYDDTTRVQRLVRLIALCPACHEVKHLGLAAKRGRHGAALAHLARVNGWTAVPPPKDRSPRGPSPGWTYEGDGHWAQTDGDACADGCAADPD